MDEEVVRMARAAAEGDFESLLPLSDRLKELGDERWRDIHAAVGRASITKGHRRGPERGIMAGRLLRENIRAIFWPELHEGGAAGFLRELSRAAREPAPDSVQPMEDDE